jgi:outer membrane lipoprotein-sorting protein
MKQLHLIFTGLCLTLASTASHAQLADSLRRIDATSATFKSAQADVHTVSFVALIKDETAQDGMIYVDGKAPKMEMGLKLNNPDARTMDYKNGLLRVFNPALGCYNKVASTNGQAESFLALGFGGSGADLQKEWIVTDLGSEPMTSDGKPVKVEKLDLVPKAQSVKNNASHVTVWIDLSRGIGLKQIIYAPNGDTRTAIYSNVRLNAAVNKKPYDFKDTLCK